MSAIYAKRFEAVFLCTHPRGPKMSHAAASKYMKVSRQFVTKWVNRFLDVGNVDDYPNRGRDGKVSQKAEKMILTLFSKNPTLTLREGVEKLARKSVNISYETIRRHLRKNGIKYRSTLLKPLLSENHVTKRLAWAQDNKDRDWGKVIFSDEASFWAFPSIQHAWANSTNRLLQRTMKHPVKVHVWGCFSEKGFGTLHLFTDNLNAEKMKKIYQKALIPSAKCMYGANNDDWILQEDNDPKHRSRACKLWKEENGVVTLDWPSQSPDANPIENVWAVIKMKLQNKRPTHLKQLCRQIRQIWRSLPKDYAENLVASMPRRCQAIIDAGGDWTTY